MKNKYFSLYQEGREANIDIYGDITSWPWTESDVSAFNLSRQIEELGDVEQINVHINSYGGEVAEGLAIYNALRRHSAKIVTTCDGFACSIASVIFMAGDERLMSDASLLMIHNAWTYGAGNSEELRKMADDLETITSASKAAYMASVSITEKELTELMDAETWISPSDAVEKGFATAVETFTSDKPSQSAREAICQKLLSPSDVPSLTQADVLAAVKAALAEQEEDEEEEEDEEGDPEDEEEEAEESAKQLCRFFELSAKGV